MNKYCIDCKWHELVTGDHRCVCPWIREQDLVTGLDKVKYCRVERMNAGTKTSCGEDGKHWEARQ